MATYFHGVPEIQPVDGLQTLYLMNPSYVAYTADSSSPPTTSHHHHHPNNMLFLNSPLTSLAPQQQQQQQQQNPQHYVGIPLQTLQDSSYSLWAPNMSSIDFHSQLGMKRGPSSSSDAPGSSQQQGLSLSLSPEVQAAVAAAAEAGEGGRGGEEVKMVGVMGSKYLKAAQELLDEVVSVGKGSIHGGREKGKETRDKIAGKEEDGGGDGGGGTGSGGGDMSTAERQELQMKKAKLVHMLDEVEQRYRQYHHQMQMVVSSFEAVAGFGSAKSYTALALQTISKQFRCLRDAIAAQVRATGKSLGEEDCLAGSKSSMGSRLRFVDHHLRQQRALQQLGMIQHNAWRPQRGLPERSVSVLRAWLFEHFLHPYPKDSDKHMLAKQTGLTRSQVSNWFINARVRLWKPMVEEMYLEETKGQEQSNNNDDDDNNNTTKTSKSEATNHSHSPSKSPTTTTTTSSPSVADHHPKPVSIGQKQSSPLPPPPLPSSEYGATMMFTVGDPLIQQRMKKSRTCEDNDNNNISSNNNMVHDELSNRELLMKFMDHSGGFGGYPMSEIAHFHHQQQQQQQFSAPRFGGNGAVSLTLGLPHCEYLTNEGIQMSSGENNNNNNYFNLNNTNSNNMSHHHPSGSHSTPNVYESISIQNRKRFAAHQLLPDYVA